MRERIIQRALERLETLGKISDHPEHRVRTLLSDANLRAARVIEGWMRETGLSVEHTVDGSIRGILQGSGAPSPPLLIGSHFDTVVDAGAYDGPLGIISALAAIEILRLEGIHLPFPLHLLAFSDEEGVRFHTTYIGSKGMTGALDPASLATVDQSGKTLAEALASEGWHENASTINYQDKKALGYVELHIEQGRILEEMNQAVSAVTSLAGQTRLRVSVTGRSDHAGTTPMALRRDALAGAAECVLALERLSRIDPDSVATIGQLEVHPGSTNVIPGAVSFSVDLRHPQDGGRQHLQQSALSDFEEICATRGLSLEIETMVDDAATACDPGLSSLLLESVESLTGTRTSLVSGAGHDAISFAPIMPIGMIFIRCRDGLSHHPDEFVTPTDIATGIDVLTHFLRESTQLPVSDHAGV